MMIIKLSYAQKGASVVHWLLAMIPLLGFGVLAVDINNIYVAQAELQNAADAGALEGARLLYTSDGEINIGQEGISPNAAATNAARANLSQGDEVEVVTVKRGHWEYTNIDTVDADGIVRGGVFTANPTIDAAPLIDADGNFRSFEDLNTDLDEINAVEVVTARQLTPIQAFFGPVLGINGYQMQARSVAYIGFVGTIHPEDIDTPIAMCQEILLEGCDVGRLVPSPDQTGGWTNLETFEDNTCGGASNATELKTLVNTGCSGSGINTHEIRLGVEIQVNNGQVNSAFADLYDCWKATAPEGEEWPTEPVVWNMPVVYGCSFGGDCATVAGAVRVEVLWMILNNPTDVTSNNYIDNVAPWAMEDWAAPEGANGITRWNSFVDHFGLIIESNPFTPATWENGGAIQKTMYFKPSCEAIELGDTGGANFGIRAKVPVLVY